MLAGLLMLAGVAAIVWLGAPGLLTRLGLPVGATESPLRLKDNPIERRELENGSELFAVSGRVTNPSSERQRVPDIRAELRDAQGRLVYSWTITPQQRSLAAGRRDRVQLGQARRALQFQAAGAELCRRSGALKAAALRPHRQKSHMGHTIRAFAAPGGATVARHRARPIREPARSRSLPRLRR